MIDCEAPESVLTVTFLQSTVNDLAAEPTMARVRESDEGLVVDLIPESVR